MTATNSPLSMTSDTPRSAGTSVWPTLIPPETFQRIGDRHGKSHSARRSSHWSAASLTPPPGGWLCDGARILAPWLFGRARDGLTRLIHEFGEHAIDTIKAVLVRAMIDGMAPSSVTTWSYFRSALREQRVLEEMAAAGLRPGDASSDALLITLLLSFDWRTASPA
jgi:hypothetical protein